MALFGAKKEEKKDEPRGKIVGFTKPKKFFFLKFGRSQPIYDPQHSQQAGQSQQAARTAQPAQPVQRAQPARPAQSAQPSWPTFTAFQPKPRVRPTPTITPAPAQTPTFAPAAHGAQAGPQMQKPSSKRPNQLQMYWVSVAGAHKELDAALRAQSVKESPYEFVRKMFIYAVAVSAIITVSVSMLLVSYGVSPLLGLILGIACYYGLFNRFISYPLDRSVVVGKEIEKDILFAARDLVISMRSGMPLFNAITAVSTGYGAASQEFAKVVELVQLGTPIGQALDEVSSRSESRTFKRIMLQATVSLKAGADVVGALQGVVEEVGQERVIELRRYGQRLNALAMFYMLFGIIFPSMGIAVAAILTTFINLFTVDENTLLFAAIGIFFLQIIFLNIMRSSRPTFAM